MTKTLACSLPRVAGRERQSLGSSVRESFEDIERTCPVAVVKGDHKFFAAPTGQHVTGADAVSNRSHEFDQHHVAGRVPVTIVEGFEVIEVEHGHHRVARAVVLDRVDSVVCLAATVEGACELVRSGGAEDAVLQSLSRRDIHSGSHRPYGAEGADERNQCQKRPPNLSRRPNEPGLDRHRSISRPTGCHEISHAGMQRPVFGVGMDPSRLPDQIRRGHSDEYTVSGIHFDELAVLVGVRV